MATHVKSRYEELVKNKKQTMFLFLWAGFVITCIGFVLLPVAGLLMFVGILIISLGLIFEPSEEEERLAEAEKQKRIAEQIAFNDAVLKVQRDHQLNLIQQALVQQTAPPAPPALPPPPVEDPEIGKLRRQYELHDYRQKEQSKQVLKNVKAVAEIIRELKHVERDGLAAIEEMVASKIIDEKDASLFKELIKDTVMEGIHVDRRGKRSRSFS